MIHICYLLYYIIGLINIHVHVNMNYQIMLIIIWVYNMKMDIQDCVKVK